MLVLLVTLGWKIAVHGVQLNEAKEENVYFKLAEFLARQHFVVASFEKLEEGDPILATAGSCRMLVVKSGSQGSDRDRIRAYATAEDVNFVVFGGKVYAEQPTWQTALDAVWSKLRRELGMNAQATPVFAVIATKNCEAERLPWEQLG